MGHQRVVIHPNLIEGQNMRHFLRHGVEKVCRSRRTLQEVIRQTVAALLIAAMPATTLPVDAATMAPMRQARAPQSLPSFFPPPLPLNPAHVFDQLSEHTS